MLSYQISPKVIPSDIAKLRKSVGWNGMESYYDKAMENSYFHLCCYDDHDLVGFLDVVSNKSTDAYIQDLMVKPLYQGKGIGTMLMNMAIEKLKQDQIYMISVLFEEKLLSFYQRFGFITLLSGQLQTHDAE